jgi:hypothetical protein
MNGIRANTHFAIKSIINEKPYLLCVIVFVGSALLSGYFMCVFERPLSTISG